MKLLSIQTGLPKKVIFHGKEVETGIFKTPVQGPIKVNFLNLEGDGQADLTVHGGKDKAVYAYSFDTYDWWKKERPNDVIDYGAMGENLTFDMLDEGSLYIGDTFQIGSCILQVAQPRFPCFKLGVMYKDMTIVKTFMKYARPGVYFRVLQEGHIDTGHELKLLDREKTLLSISELFLMKNTPLTPAKARSYSQIASLPDYFREEFQAIADSE